MSGLEPILAHVVPFALVMARLAGLVVAAPIVSNVGVPMRARALVAVTLAVAVYPTVPHADMDPGQTGWMDLVPMLVGETLIGAAIGLIAATPLLMMEMAGVTGGQMMGLGLARVYNPEMDTDMDVMGQLMFMAAAACFVSVGGLEWLFRCLASTFAHVPAGGIGLSEAPLDLLVGIVTSGAEVALRVSSPIVAMVLLLIVAIGFLGKTMPQLNVMSIGFILKVMGGLSALALSTTAMHAAVGDEIVRVLRVVADWVSGL